MSKIVREPQLRTVIDGLWGKSKDKFIEDITYNQADKKLKKVRNGQEEEVVEIITLGDLTQVGGTAQQAGKIPQLKNDGKLDETMIPELPIDRITDLRVELDGKVTSVNNIHPVAGNVTVASNDISYDNAISNLVSNNVKEAIDELSIKVNNSYINSEYNSDTGILTLIKEDGTRDERNFGKGLIKDVAYDIQTQKLKVETVDGTIFEVDLTDLASKTLDNYFEGENLFDKLFITDSKPFEGNIGEYTYNAGGHKQTGRRDYTSHSQGNNGYVDHLLIRLANNLATNRRVQVKYWIIEKGNTVAQDKIIKEVAYKEYQVEEEMNLGASARIVRVPIKMKFDNPTYFIYQVDSSSDMAYTTTSVGNESLYLSVSGVNAPLSIQTLVDNIGRNDGANHSGSYAISGGMTNIRDLLNSTGTVKTVNGQPSDNQGNVTVNSEHISYNNQTSNLASNNVKEAIDELNGKFVSNVSFVEATRTLKQTINNQEQEIVNGIVTKWEDLEHVKKYEITNLVDYSKRQNGVKFNADGQNIINDVNCGLVSFKVEGNQEYTLLRQRAYHVRIRFEDVNGGFIEFLDTPTRIYNGWNRVKFTTPQNAITAILELLVSQANEKEVMVLKGNQLNLSVDTRNPIPFTDSKVLQIGKEVSYAFDNSNSNIKSTTVESAIKELDMKVANAGTGTVTSVNNVQPINGNVQIEINNIDNLETTLEGKVPKTDLVSIPTPDKVPQLNNQGKLDIAFLPDLSFNQVHSVADKTEAINLINANTARVGDIFIVRNNNNSVHMYVNQAGADFDTKCVELTMANGTVRTVNGKTPDAQGNVRINADNITLANGNSNVEAELNKKIQSINSVVGIDGNVNLSIDNTTNNVEFKVDTYTFGILNYMTDQQADNIINGWSL